jgi:transcriptional regulator
MQIVKTLERQAIDLLGLHKRTLTGRGHFAIVLRHTMRLTLRKRGWAYQKIARELGYKDHTTVLHAVAKMTKRFDTDRFYAEKVTKLVEYRDPPVKLAA